MSEHVLERVTQRNAARRQGETLERVVSDRQTPHPLLRLQHQVGNAVVARMLAQREGEDEAGEAEDDEIALMRQVDPQQMALMREGDEDEMALMREGDEDEMALMREGDEDEMALMREGDEDEMALMRASSERQTLQKLGTPQIGLEGGPVGDEVASAVQNERGRGSGLADEHRGQFEQSFGTSFDDVRIHTDSAADTLNRTVGAKAFTTGSDIFFRSGMYRPESSDGRKVLSHELTHVVQQRSMGGAGGGPMTVTAAGDAHEQEADKVAGALESPSSSDSAGGTVGRSVDRDR